MALSCVICKENFQSCRCLIGDFRSLSDPVKEGYAKLYKEIATEDSLHPMQAIDNLEKKASIDLHRISKLLKNSKRMDARVLEVGPGLGHLGRALASRCDYSSTDITKEYISEMPGRRFLCDIEDLPKFDNRNASATGYDLVIACDVIEHVLNEGSAILSVHQALTPGGKFYIRTPLDEPLINYAQTLGAPFPFVHLRTYNTKALKRLAKSAGFRRITIGKSLDSPTGFSRRTVFQLAKMAHLRNELRVAYKSDSPDSPDSLNVRWSKCFLLQLKLEGLILGSISRTPLRQSYFYALMLKIFYRPNEIWMVAVK